jgi:hypothetical protein
MQELKDIAARTLARRWVLTNVTVGCSGCGVGLAPHGSECVVTLVAATPPLDKQERELLLDWVRRRVDTYHAFPSVTCTELIRLLLDIRQQEAATLRTEAGALCRDEARALAQRWVQHGLLDNVRAHPEALDGREWPALLEWVRRRMAWLAQGVSKWSAGGQLAVGDAIAKDLGLDVHVGHELCEIAGWPAFT